MFPKRERPLRLSNRNCCYDDDEMRAVDAKELGALAWQDFEAVFPLSRCTAEYGEQLFYLPLALQSMKESRGEGNELVAGLISFIARHREQLAADGFLDASLAALRACLVEWTSTFEVISAKRVPDSVANASAVWGLLDHLLQSEIWDVAQEWIESLTSLRRTPLACAWLLELADSKPWNLYGTTWSDLALQTAYDEIKDTIVANEPSPTYWPNLVTSLGLTP